MTLKPHLSDPDFKMYCGDALEVLRQLPDQHVHCIVCSPPYYAQRNYQVDGQLGLEKTMEEYVAKLVEVFAEARRVLRNDGTLWLNLGDTYASNWGMGRKASWISSNSGEDEGRGWGVETSLPPNQFPTRGKGLKVKDLCGIPWNVALALRDDGWYLRRDIVWSKPGPMPESVKDRCTTSHEYIFMLSKRPNYYYNQDAIREPYNYDGRKITTVKGQEGSAQHRNGERWPGIGRNKRSVWEVPTRNYEGAHFATWPEALVEPMILAGCPEGGTVLDCFAGAGTTALVARKLGRKSIGIELSRDYCELASRRLSQLSLLTEDEYERGLPLVQSAQEDHHDD